MVKIDVLLLRPLAAIILDNEQPLLYILMIVLLRSNREIPLADCTSGLCLSLFRWLAERLTAATSADNAPSMLSISEVLVSGNRTFRESILSWMDMIRTPFIRHISMKIASSRGPRSALLFSAISLIMLAYTNRFLSYANLVRTLKDQYLESHSKVTAAQIQNLRKRLYLTRAMQVTGIGSLLLCVVSMFTIYIGLYLASAFIFGLALILLIISLAISVYEIYISVKALELHLKDMGH